MTNFLLKLAILISLFCFFYTLNALVHAETIPEDTAVHCILGEARLQYTQYGYDALLSMAEALRNRGTTQGVYGCKPRWGRTQAQYRLDVRWMAKFDGEAAAHRAWRESRYSNLTRGATHWEGSGFKPPYWVKGMIFTVEIAGTKFYKPKNRR